MGDEQDFHQVEVAMASEQRIEDVARLQGVEAFTIACPKVVTLFQDAVKTTGDKDRNKVH